MKRRLFCVFAVALLWALYLLALQQAHAIDDKKESRAVTFSRDVAPIFHKKCGECHRPNEIAPMSLLSYREARPWARAVKEKVLTREMPPWHADPNYGKFSNDARLNQEEIDTIVAWVDQGAEEGDPGDMPPAPSFVKNWKVGKPDLILTMPEEHTIAGEGSDEYVNITLPMNLKEDKWLQAAEINPGNKRVVHHVIAFLQPPQTPENLETFQSKQPPGSIFYQDGSLIKVRMDAPVFDDGCSAAEKAGQKDVAPGNKWELLGSLLCTYAPGKDVDIWPDRMAKFVPAGSSIVIQMHYSKATSKIEKDRTSVGLIFAKRPPEKPIISMGIMNHYFKIPPGADNHEVKACFKFNRDVELLAFMPHMHLRGKDMKYEALYPDGRREILLGVPEYRFNWQLMYRLERPISMPKGSSLVVTAHYDNSERNRYNPDPTKAIRFGESSYDEMMIGFVDFAPKHINRTPIELDPKIYDLYVGDYRLSERIYIKIKREGNRLIASSTGQPEFEILPASETAFFFRDLDTRIIFVKDDRGEVSELIFEIEGHSLKAKKVSKQ